MQKIPKSCYFENYKVRRSDMLSSYKHKNKYLNSSTTSFFTLQSDFEEKKFGANNRPFHLLPEYFLIPMQKIPKYCYFEKNKVKRSDMQSSTDLCMTV